MDRILIVWPSSKILKHICMATSLLIIFVLIMMTPIFPQGVVLENQKMDEKDTTNIFNNHHGQNQSVTNRKIVSITHLTYVQVKDLSIPFRQSGTGPYYNLLDAEPPTYLDDFRNPCWREEFNSTNPYPENGYFVQKMPAPFRRMLSQHFKEGQPWRLRCLPYFYLAGFVKSGTTELFINVRNHPMVAKNRKEIHWWTRYRNCVEGSGAVPIRDYIDLFDDAAISIDHSIIMDNNGHRQYHPMIIGDGSTITVCQQKCWWNHPENKARQLGVDFPKYINAHYIRHVTPGAKFIVSMRHPVNRLYSQYTMHKGLGPEDFHIRVKAAVKNMKACIKQHSLFACTDIPTATTIEKFALSDSMYYAHVVRWLRVFPRRQFHFVKLEDFNKDRIVGLNQIFEFLELEPVAEDVLEKESYNIRIGCKTCTVPLMFNKTRILLNDFFQPYNTLLADLLHDERWVFL